MAGSDSNSGEKPRAKRMKRDTKIGVFSCGTGVFGELAQGTEVTEQK